MKSVTIITVYYNRRDHVDRSIRSLIDQDHSNRKIVVIDDGSTDGTWEELQKFAGLVDLRRQANVGFTNSIVSAVRAAETEYIAIHGSGDISHSSRISRQLEDIGRDPRLVLCATSSQNIDARTGSILGTQTFSNSRITRNDVMDHPPFTHGSVLFRTASYIAAGGYDPRFLYCQDWDLWLRMLSLGDGCYISDVLYDRLVQADGASSSAGKASRQLLYKHLALKLASSGASEREAIFEQFAASSDSIGGYLLEGDLTRRLVKLSLLGDRSGVQFLSAELARMGAKPSLSIRLVIQAAFWLRGMGVDPGWAMRFARRAKEWRS